MKEMAIQLEDKTVKAYKMPERRNLIGKAEFAIRVEDSEETSIVEYSSAADMMDAIDDIIKSSF